MMIQMSIISSNVGTLGVTNTIIDLLCCLNICNVNE